MAAHNLSETGNLLPRGNHRDRSIIPVRNHTDTSFGMFNTAVLFLIGGDALGIVILIAAALGLAYWGQPDT